MDTCRAAMGAKPGGTGRSATGSAGPGGSFGGLAQGTQMHRRPSLRRCSTWWPGSEARRTTYSRWWVPKVVATAGRGRWGTASFQRQIASISRSRHTSFHRSRTSGQLRVRGSERKRLGGSDVLVWKPQSGVDNSTFEELPGDQVFKGMCKKIANLEKCKTGKIIWHLEVQKMREQHPKMRFPARWVCTEVSS